MNMMNTQNDCHLHWLSDSSRVHQIRFRPGLRPKPRWGSLQRSPNPLAGLRGALLLREGRGGKDKRRKKIGEGRNSGGIEGKGREGK